MNYLFSLSLTKRIAALSAGIFFLALSAAAPLCGDGSTPIKNLLPQGTMQGDLDAGGHSLNNAATVNATTVNATRLVVSGNVSTPSNLSLLLGPSNHNFVFLGDSLTEAPTGNPPFQYLSFAAVFQYLGACQSGSAYSYNLGFRTETTAQVYNQYNGGGEVHPTVSTTSGSTTATLSSYTGVSAGMVICSANIPPNTTVTAVTGTTSITLSQKATATAGTVASSIAAAPTDSPYAELYAGGAANNWQNFSGTAHGLSPAISGLGGDLAILLGANDYNENTSATTTLTCTTTSGSPNATVTSGSVTGVINGLVLTSTNLPSSPPPTIVSGGTTTTLVLSANATASGSTTVTVHYPVTALATWKTTYTSLVSAAHTDGYTVAIMTLPASNNTGQGSPVSNVFRNEFNGWLLANGPAADYVFDLASQFPPYGSLANCPYLVPNDGHFTIAGCAMVGRFLNQQYFLQKYTAQLAWNPFSVNGLPDPWHSANIPRLNQSNVFNPGTNTITATGNLTAGSTLMTGVTSTVGLFSGMYAGGGNLLPPLTVISSISGSTITLSANANKSVTGVGVYFSNSPFPAQTVVKGDSLILGPALDNSAAFSTNLAFTSAGDSFNPGIVWQNTSGAAGASITAPTATSGTMTLGWGGGTSGTGANIQLNSGSGNMILTAGTSGNNTLAINASRIAQSYGGTGFAFDATDVNNPYLEFRAFNAPSGSRDFTWRNASGVLEYRCYDDSHSSSQLIYTITASSSAVTGTEFKNGYLRVDNNLISDLAGSGLQVKEGSNCKQGTATLSSGTVTVSNTAVTANSRIFLTAQSLGTVTAPKDLAVTARTAGTSFTITSSDATDTSVVAYEIFEPAP